MSIWGYLNCHLIYDFISIIFIVFFVSTWRATWTRGKIKK